MPKASYGLIHLRETESPLCCLNVKNPKPGWSFVHRLMADIPYDLVFWGLENIMEGYVKSTTLRFEENAVPLTPSYYKLSYLFSEFRQPVSLFFQVIRDLILLLSSVSPAEHVSGNQSQRVGRLRKRFECL